MQNQSRIQRIVHLVGLVLAPLLAFAWVWEERKFEFSDGAGRFKALNEHPDIVARHALVFFLLQLALVAAVLTYPWLVRGRGRVLVLLGVGFLVMSTLGHSALAGSDMLASSMMNSDEPRAMVKAYAEFEDSAEFTAAAAAGLLGLLLGNILLGIGLIRSTELHWLVGAGFITFIVADIILFNFSPEFVFVAVAGWAGAMWYTASRALTDASRAPREPARAGS